PLTRPPRTPPPHATAGEDRACAAAENTQPAADTNMAVSTASQQIVNRLETNPPPPGLTLSPPPPTHASGDKALYEFHDPEMDEIIPGGKHHQGQHQSQADAEAVLLGPLTQRFPANRLSGIEQQMSAVKHRHREQVDQPKIDRQHRHEPEQRDDAALRDFARHLRDPQRSAKLVAGTGSDNDLPHRLERRGGQVPGFADCPHHGARRVSPDILDAAAPDA